MRSQARRRTGRARFRESVHRRCFTSSSQDGAGSGHSSARASINMTVILNSSKPHRDGSPIQGRRSSSFRHIYKGARQTNRYFVIAHYSSDLARFHFRRSSVRPGSRSSCRRTWNGNIRVSKGVRVFRGHRSYVLTRRASIYSSRRTRISKVRTNRHRGAYRGTKGLRFYSRGTDSRSN